LGEFVFVVTVIEPHLPLIELGDSLDCFRDMLLLGLEDFAHCGCFGFAPLGESAFGVGGVLVAPLLEVRQEFLNVTRSGRLELLDDRCAELDAGGFEQRLVEQPERLLFGRAGVRLQLAASD
jgi:hypothetical protein